MIFTECPSCDELIWFKNKPVAGQKAVCPYCKAQSQVASESPLELEPDLEVMGHRTRKRRDRAGEPDFHDLRLEDQEKPQREAVRHHKSWRSHQAQRQREQARSATEID